MQFNQVHKTHETELNNVDVKVMALKATFRNFYF